MDNSLSICETLTWFTIQCGYPEDTYSKTPLLTGYLVLSSRDPLRSSIETFISVNSRIHIVLYKKKELDLHCLSNSNIHSDIGNLYIFLLNYALSLVTIHVDNGFAEFRFLELIMINSPERLVNGKLLLNENVRDD